MSDTESAVGADSQTVTLLFADSDSASGADTALLTAATSSPVETGTASESTSVASDPYTEIGVASDSQTGVAAALPDSDTAAAIQGQALVLADSDAGSGAEASLLAAAIIKPESGAGADASILSVSFTTSVTVTTSVTGTLSRDPQMASVQNTATFAVSGVLASPVLPLAGTVTFTTDVGEPSWDRIVTGLAPSLWFTFENLNRAYVDATSHVITAPQAIRDTTATTVASSGGGFYADQPALIPGATDKASIRSIADYQGGMNFAAEPGTIQQEKWFPPPESTGWSFAALITHRANSHTENATNTLYLFNSPPLTAYFQFNGFQRTCTLYFGGYVFSSANMLTFNIPASVFFTINPMFIVITWAVSGVVSLYINGILIGTAGNRFVSSNWNSYYTNGALFQIGISGYPTVQDWDEVGFWTRKALSPGEISTLWSAAQNRAIFWLPNTLGDVTNTASAQVTVVVNSPTLHTVMVSLTGTTTVITTVTGDTMPLMPGGVAALTVTVTGTLLSQLLLESWTADLTQGANSYFDVVGQLTVIAPPVPAPTPANWMATTTGSASAGATTLTISPLTTSIPSGAALYTSGGLTVTLSQPANAGDITLAVYPTSGPIASGITFTGIAPVYWQASTTASAPSGSTTITVAVTPTFMPAGTVLYEADGSTVTLTQDAPAGSTVLHVASTSSAISAGSTLTTTAPPPPPPVGQPYVPPAPPPAPPDPNEGFPPVKRISIIMPAPTLDEYWRPI